MKSLIVTLVLLFSLFTFMGCSGASDNGGSTSATSNVCKRCEGSGVIATYSTLGCKDPLSHYQGDCKAEEHTSSCTASGSKTCPCCHGSGKL